MSELRLNAIRLNTVSLNTMPINSIGFKKKASSPSSGDVDENGYIIFADPEVARICATNWGDGIGITKEQAAAVTSIGTVFSGNTEIESFNELGLFGGEEGVSVSFLGCANLESVDLTNVVGGTENGFFSGLDSLHIDIDMPRLKTFPYKGFANSAITGVKNLGLITSIPSAFAYAENGAFYQCTELKYANIPEVITTLPMALFADCSALSEIHLAWEKIERIEPSVFTRCTSLEIEDLSLPNLVSLGGGAFLGVKIKKISNLGSITTLNNRTFRELSVLEEVVLPDTMESIGEYTFAYCPQMKSVRFSPNIKSIAKEAFAWGNAMGETVVDLPNLTDLGDSAFVESGIKGVTSLGSLSKINDAPYGTTGTFAKNLNLSFVILPETLTYIGSCAFYNCTAMRAVVLHPEVPPTLGNVNAFNNTNNCPIYVPDASVEAYKGATNWSTYAARIFPISQLQTDNPEFYAEIEEYL